jgi:hypothetical protein
MDPLTQFHHHESANEHQVTQQHLIVGLAQHALRNIPHHEHVLKTIAPRVTHSNDFEPQHYKNSKHIQMMLG